MLRASQPPEGPCRARRASSRSRSRTAGSRSATRARSRRDRCFRCATSANDLVLYRGESGAARVLDAYCPHLGANIGRGGKVEGDTIRCPFHGWRFGADGACVEVPYAQRIPPKARLAGYPLIERNGAIWVWRHAEGKPPDWDVPEIPEFSSPDWTRARLLPLEDRHAQPGDGRERRRQGALPLRARHDGRCPNPRSPWTACGAGR